MRQTFWKLDSGKMLKLVLDMAQAWAYWEAQEVSSEADLLELG